MKVNKVFVYIVAIGLLLGCSTSIFAQPTQEELSSEVMSLKECVIYAVYNSFEAKMAKLDLYIAQTDLTYEEAVYDTVFYGSMGYEKDRRASNSVFAASDEQTNDALVGIKKTLPTGTKLSAELTDTRLWNNSAYLTQNPSHTTQLLLRAEQPIGQNIFGHNYRKQISLTKLAIENAAVDERDRIEALIADVSRAYWGLILEKNSLEIYTDILSKARELHKANTKNFEIGLIEKVDLLASASNVARVQADVLLAENDFKRSEKNLKLIMNFDDEKRVLPIDDINFKPTNKQLPDCLEESFKKRRDYDKAKRDVRLKGLNLKVKKNMRWPEIDLSLSLAANGIDSDFNNSFDRTTDADNDYYYAQVKFTFPLENRKARSEHLKAKHEKERALLKLKEIERKVITEVGNAFYDVIAYQGALGYIKEMVQMQKKKFEEEEKRFSYGRSNTKRLIDYQQDLLQAQLKEVDSLIRYEKAKINLDRTMNTMLSEYEELL